MKKINRAISKLLLGACSITFLCSCSLFQNGDINNFTGVYITGTGTETTKHYYWGHTSIVGEKQIMPSGCKIIIYPNKKVTFQYSSESNIIIGKIRVYTDYATFKDLNFDSSYKFTLKSDHSLSYTYYQDKHGLDYDFITRSMYFNYQGPVVE